MKKEIVDLFTMRVIDFTLINWLELMLIITLLSFIYAVIKAIAESK